MYRMEEKDMEGSLRVTPEELISAASEFQSEGDKIHNITQEMMNTVNSLKASFQGETAAAYFEKFNQLQDDMDRIFGKIKEHAADLTAIGEEYARVTHTTTQEAGSMPGDVIV